MKINLQLDNELDDAIQRHLDGKVGSVQQYVKASLRFFRDMLRKEEEGKAVGFGDKSRFPSYNTEASPKTYLAGSEAE